MNREKRRKAKNNKKVATYNFSIDQIQKIKEDATNDAIKLMIVCEMYISIMVLRDEFGFGKKRIEHFANAHNELLDSLQKDYLSYTDMMDTIEEETGFRYELEVE